MCRRLKDHGRDTLEFSVSGWRQVSARQKRVHSDSIMFGVWWPTDAGFTAALLWDNSSGGSNVVGALLSLPSDKTEAGKASTTWRRQKSSLGVKNRRQSHPEFGTCVNILPHVTKLSSILDVHWV
jgi:hypothetical protein